MAKARNFSELRNRLPAESRARVEARVKLTLHDMALDELRTARELTQQRLAETLGIKQATVSKIERQSDMYVSTLAKFIEAMGGTLEIRACFPEGSVRIKQFSEARSPLRGVGRGEHVGHTHADQLAARGADPGAVERNEVALRATHRAAGDLAPREQAAQVEFLAGGRVALAQQPGRVLGAFGHQIHERCGAIHILPAILQVDARIPRTARPLVVDLGGGDLFAGVRGLEHVAQGILLKLVAGGRRRQRRGQR
jgi:transcriptional regulator with XRE-family HTH domain